MRLYIYIVLALFLPVVGFAQQADFASIAQKLAGANYAPIMTEWSIAGEQAAVKAEIAPEDPEVNFAYIWPHDADVLNRWELEISQTLPDFRRMKAAGKIVSALEIQKKFEIQAIRSENLYNAHVKLIELIAARKDCDLMHSIHENFDSLSVSYQKAWNRGEVSILDVNKIKIEHARAEAANLEAEGRYHALLQELVTLANGKVSAEQLQALSEYPVFGSEAKLTPGAKKNCLSGDASSTAITHGCDSNFRDSAEICCDNETLMSLLVNSPQYLLAESRLSVARQKVDYAAKARFPQLSLGYKHTYEDGMHFNDLLVGMTLPLWSRRQEKLSAQGELFALQAENTQAVTDLMAEVKNNFVKAAALKRQLDALGPIIEQTNNVRLVQMALDGGEISLLEYLQEIGYFSDAIREYNAIRLDYTLTVASLARYF